MDGDCGGRKTKRLADRARDRGTDISGSGTRPVLDREGRSGSAGGAGAGGDRQKVERSKAVDVNGIGHTHMTCKARVNMQVVS